MRYLFTLLLAGCFVPTSGRAEPEQVVRQVESVKVVELDSGPSVQDTDACHHQRLYPGQSIRSADPSCPPEIMPDYNPVMPWDPSPIIK